MDYQILPLDENDLVECSQLYVETFRHEPWNESWGVDDALKRLSNFLASPYSIGLKTLYKGEIQGFLVGDIEQWRSYQNFNLKEMCVAKEIQRSGIGRKMVLALQDELIKQNISRIYLITQREAIPEIFYKSLGFETNGKLVIMGKSIEGPN